jgi:hypothetical protein
MYDNYSVWIEGLAKSILFIEFETKMFIATTFTSWIIKQEENEALATGHIIWQKSMMKKNAV